MAIAKLENGLHVYYEEMGAGLPVVFIHPPGMSHVVFKYQRSLAQEFRVITYDIRGHGGSSWEDSASLSIPILASDLLGLLDHLTINRAVICGYSAGGSIAQEFALRYPERTEALVLSGGFPEVNTTILSKQFQLGMIMAEKCPNVLGKLLSWTHKNNQNDREALYAYDMKCNRIAWRMYYHASYRYNCTEQLKTIQVPTLLFYGDRSFYMHPYYHVYKKHVPAHLLHAVIVPKSLHQIPIRKYDYFNKKLAEFLNGLQAI
ncbi:alpha/beta hydrolase [Fictibacillus sp. Mic-4]|uniref:alpha/beta fold hydrolase n=1 Tax=Fictibacillus sp. Mic-4 TaxID=3132826 RepID=UPI003CF7B4D4